MKALDRDLFNKVDILIVDDREDGLIALEATLSDQSYNIVKADSGYAALETLDSHDFAVILLDVQMPGIDGFETAEAIKAHPRHKHTPIVFVTAINKDESYVYRGYEYGAVDYVFKPFDPEIIKSKVAVFVDLYRKDRQLREQNTLIQESERRERYLRLAELEVESLKRYRNLADSIPHAVWRARSDGTMDYFNRVWCDFTGLSLEQSVGIGWESAFEGEDLRNFLKTWIHAMTHSTEFQAECRIKQSNGDYRWHWVRGMPERRLNGDIVAWLGTCTDIHERKLIEDKLVEARVEADAANRAKTHFLANMSHEIRTPLNSIMGFAELMQLGNMTESDFDKSLSTIRRNGHQLIKIIDEILDISKVEAGRLEVEQTQADLHSIISEVHALMEIQAKEKNLTLEFSCIGKVPEKIQTDPLRLRQILVNIVGNAIKFTTAGSVKAEVEWKKNVNQDSGRITIAVTDSGVGIDPDQANRLFQPFQQVDSSTTRKFGGTGLGLALSRRLARALDGDVYLRESNEGQGSTFVVEVATPLLEESGWFTKIRDINETLAQQHKFNDSSKKTKPILENVRVLVVDDAMDNRTLLSRFLIAAGALVETAVNGQEGIDKAMSDDFAVVLMDIQMPQVDGYEATAQLRSNGYKRPIIALTAHALKEERDKSLRAGCDDHLTKPIDKSTLISQVAKHAGRVLH